LDACLGPWFVADLITLIGIGVVVDYAVLMPPLETVLCQLARRTDHGFRSEDATRHMYREFASSLSGLDEHVIDASGLAAADIASAVELAGRQGRLRLTGDHLPG
jgi:hypothetical protein